MNKLHRFTEDGRYAGFIVEDRPIGQYAHRTDLTDKEPPAAEGKWPYFVGGIWTLKDESVLMGGTPFTIG